MIIENIRLSEASKKQLINMKRRTGIGQWNILCRWAFCLSVAENKPLQASPTKGSSNVEMTWKTFAGPFSPFYEAIVRLETNNTTNQENAPINFVIGHIDRGLALLSNKRDLQSIGDLFKIIRINK